MNSNKVFLASRRLLL
jgi:hypothetical protein